MTERTTRVLIAEDEPNIRQYVQDILAGLPDIELVCVASGEAAVERLERETWDIVISDQRMGVTDGIGVLKVAAKLHPQAQRAMITGFAEVALIAEAKNDAGVHRFMSKPFSPEEFADVVKTLAEHVRSEADRASAFARALALTENA